MLKASSTDGAKDQRAQNDEQPAPEQYTVVMAPPEDSEEKESGEPLAVLSSGINSNAGPSQPPEPHVQEETSEVAPDGDLAPEEEKVVEEKDQPSLSELANVMKQVLDVLQDSTIASKNGKDHRSRFWGVYKRVAEEHDGEFLEQYTSDMDIVLVFSGLFSAVSTSFIVAMEANLTPNPSDTTNVLLTQLVYIGLGNLAAAGSAPATPTWSPTTTAIRIQAIAYASLSMSLLAAFGAVLGKQWLGYYKSNRYGRGSQEERGKRRQEKFDGLITWYFDAVVQSFPVLLQISLLLFGIALSANIWYKEPSIAWVIIATTVFGFLFYSLTVMACLISPSCPFQTPISTVLRMLHIDRLLRLIFEPAFRYLRQLASSPHGALQRLLGALRSSCTRVSEALTGPVRATGAFARQLHQLVSAALHKGLYHLVPHSPTKAVDSEAQLFGQGPDVLAEKECTLTLDLPDTPTSGLEAPSIKWLLETSTDPEVFLAAANLVPQVEWPLDFDVSDILPQLYDIFTSCVDIQRQIVPSLEEKASACTMALSHLYSGRVLQAYPGRGGFLGGSELFGRRRTDYLMFLQMSVRGTCTADDVVLATTRNLCIPENVYMRFPFWLGACPNSVFEWLSHVLPYHFVTGRVNEDREKLAITVISKLLSSPSSPSTQIVANCTLLACVMVNVQVDKKDIVRIDKSSALPQLMESLLPQFQKALWAWDGGDLDKDGTGVTRRAWKLLSVICPMLERAQHDYSPSFDIMRNLDVCRKIYSRVRSSEQDDPRDFLHALRNAMHFMFTAENMSWDPAQLWYTQFLQGDSLLQEDFDWLVDYLDYIDFDDHEAAYDILLLLGSMGVSCSPAKQHLFVERLIAYMGSTMPDSLRHAALRAAHSAREEIASIDAIDDARLRDMILTRLSPAILSVPCPRPSPTPVDDSPDYIVDHYRSNLCYLELVCALARNSDWQPYLYGDHHIDRCISMIPEYCDPKSPTQHAFYLAGILLRIAPPQTSITSLDSVTEQQWWDVMRSAWIYSPYDIYNTRCFKLLLVLVEGTKKYMWIASKSDLEQLIGNFDRILQRLGMEQEMRQQEMQPREMRLEMRPEMPGLEEGEAITIAVEELTTVASNTLKRFDNMMLCQTPGIRGRGSGSACAEAGASRPEQNQY